MFNFFLYVFLANVGCLYILGAIGVIMHQKKYKPKEWKVISFFAIMTILVVLFHASTFFVRFKTPEAAFGYGFRGAIVDVYRGEGYAMVTSKQNFVVVTAGQRGWSVSPVDKPLIVRVEEGFRVSYIYFQCNEKTNEAIVYMSEFGSSGEKIYSIEDSLNSEFKTFYFEKVPTMALYCVIVPMDTPDYTITINGIAIPINLTESFWSNQRNFIGI